jgi:hypothetical protein
MLLTRSSGTVPPADAHSPQKKDTRKYEQQAPQFRHGLTSDMVSTEKGQEEGGVERLAILGFPLRLGSGFRKYFWMCMRLEMGSRCED